MTNAPTESPVTALLLGEYGRKDRLIVEQVFRKAGWRLFVARDRKRGLRSLTRKTVHVVLANSDAPECHWKRVLGDLRHLVPVPQLIVSSRAADDSLWSEVLNFGGYDVLAQPLNPDEVERVVASARRHFEVLPERARTMTVHSASVA